MTTQELEKTLEQFAIDHNSDYYSKEMCADHFLELRNGCKDPTFIGIIVEDYCPLHPETEIDGIRAERQKMTYLDDDEEDYPGFDCLAIFQKVTFKMCEDALEQAFSLTRHAIKEFVLENGTKLQNGYTFLPFPKHKFPCTALVSKETMKAFIDFWDEVYVLALCVEPNGDVWFFADACNMELQVDDAFNTNADGKMEMNDDIAYCLDWDCAISYQHNVERIAYWLNNSYNEE